MQIFLNGTPREISDSLTIEKLLTLLNLDPAHVAIELNQDVIVKSAFAETKLNAEDRLEVVHFVGGG